jgi:hypothetical protein
VIVTFLNAGLGNQMFQYAAGLALAEQHRSIVKLDVRWFETNKEPAQHNRYSLGCFNIIEQFATEGEIARLCGRPPGRVEAFFVRQARAMRLYLFADRYLVTGHRHEARQFSYYPEFFAQPNDTYIHGMWQSEKFFAPVADLVRRHFTFRYPALPHGAEMEARIRNGGPSAFVHFRRGDYVSKPSHTKELGVLDVAYYERAVDMLLERHPEVTLYVFSDDIRAIAQEFKPRCPHVFVDMPQPWQAYDELRLMSLCDHGITANSTFSWWAAWLNPSPNKTVIAPDPWFSDSTHDGRDVVPESWLRLARSTI